MSSLAIRLKCVQRVNWRRVGHDGQANLFYALNSIARMRQTNYCKYINTLSLSSYLSLQLERATRSELCSVLVLLLLSLSIYAFYGNLHTYLKSVLLSLRLSGPPTLPFLGNCLLINEKDCK